ncbi:PEP-CTERM sorting domain-containing protein [Pedomonas sp. V897]|uniref:PEP-CTERM sorting domain-containing protein n=1 Tax=Pedomonas sp. V897 TaxID=3446482 RepID=UPI003EE229D1
MVALMVGASTAVAATPPQTLLSAEDCDPIVIPQPDKKVVKKPVVKKVAAKKAPVSTPAQPLPQPAEGAAVAQAKPKPRPKPKPKVTTVAAKPLVIPDACPGAGSNPEDLAGLPTNLKDLIEPGAGKEALASVFPDISPMQSPVLSPLTALAPGRPQSSGPGNVGPTVPMMPGGIGGGGGSGGGGSNETVPYDPPPGGNPPGDDTPGGNPPGGNPPGGDTPPNSELPPPLPPPPKPPVKVPEPGTLGVALGGLAGLALLGGRRGRRKDR